MMRAGWNLVLVVTTAVLFLGLVMHDGGEATVRSGGGGRRRGIGEDVAVLDAVDAVLMTSGRLRWDAGMDWVVAGVRREGKVDLERGKVMEAVEKEFGLRAEVVGGGGGPGVVMPLARLQEMVGAKQWRKVRRDFPRKTWEVPVWRIEKVGLQVDAVDEPAVEPFRWRVNLPAVGDRDCSWIALLTLDFLAGNAPRARDQFFRTDGEKQRRWVATMQFDASRSDPFHPDPISLEILRRYIHAACTFPRIPWRRLSKHHRHNTMQSTSFFGFPPNHPSPRRVETDTTAIALRAELLWDVVVAAQRKCKWSFRFCSS